MNRRGFFQTVAAGIAAIFLPKSKEAETIVGVDKAVGQDETAVVYYDYTDSGTHYIFFNSNHPGFIIKESQNES